MRLEDDGTDLNLLVFVGIQSDELVLDVNGEKLDFWVWDYITFKRAVYKLSFFAYYIYSSPLVLRLTQYRIYFSEMASKVTKLKLYII